MDGQSPSDGRVDGLLRSPVTNTETLAIRKAHYAGKSVAASGISAPEEQAGRGVGSSEQPGIPEDAPAVIKADAGGHRIPTRDVPERGDQPARMYAKTGTGG